MKISEVVINEEVSYRDFYEALQEQGIGDWDNINSTDTIKSYIKEKIDEDIFVSHILEAIEQNSSEYDDWSIWLGNSMETPSPINSKQDLVDALGLSEEDLEIELDF